MSKMRILEATMEVNKESFTPEMIVKLAVPMELQNKNLTKEETYLLLGKSLMEAYEEFNTRNV